jgi:hypothetical protein
MVLEVLKETGLQQPQAFIPSYATQRWAISSLRRSVRIDRRAKSKGRGEKGREKRMMHATRHKKAYQKHRTSNTCEEQSTTPA